MSKYEQPKSNLSSSQGACLFLTLTIDSLHFNFFHFSHSTTFSEYYLPYRFLFWHLFSLYAFRNLSLHDRWLSVSCRAQTTNRLCLNLTPSHLSVPLVFLDRLCVPLTWSSWPGCLTGGSRNRNHQSLFGPLFLTKWSLSQGTKDSPKSIGSDHYHTKDKKQF